MKKIVLDISNEILVKDYLDLSSAYKVARKYNTSATAVKRILKELGVLRTQNEAAKINVSKRINWGKYTRTDIHKKRLSDLAKQKIGPKNPFYGKHHSEENRLKFGKLAKERTGKRNFNYKNGSYQKRPRDYKYAEFKPLKNECFNRDKFTCFYCKQIGNHLHAHHRIPYWVKPEAFFDINNLITLCTKCHFYKAHLGNWIKFDINLISEELMIKYSLSRERLNELTS